VLVAVDVLVFVGVLVLPIQKAAQVQDCSKGVQLPLEAGGYIMLPQFGLIPTRINPVGAPTGTVTTSVSVPLAAVDPLLPVVVTHVLPPPLAAGATQETALDAVQDEPKPTTQSG